MDSVSTGWIICRWLRHSGAYLVSHFDFLHLVNISRFNFESSVSMALSNGSIWTLYDSDGWPG